MRNVMGDHIYNNSGHSMSSEERVEGSLHSGGSSYRIPLGFQPGTTSFHSPPRPSEASLQSALQQAGLAYHSPIHQAGPAFYPPVPQAYHHSPVHDGLGALYHSPDRPGFHIPLHQEALSFQKPIPQEGSLFQQAQQSYHSPIYGSRLNFERSAHSEELSFRKPDLIHHSSSTSHSAIFPHNPPSPAQVESCISPAKEMPTMYRTHLSENVEREVTPEMDRPEEEDDERVITLSPAHLDESSHEDQEELEDRDKVNKNSMNSESPAAENSQGSSELEEHGIQKDGDASDLSQYEQMEENSQDIDGESGSRGDELDVEQVDSISQDSENTIIDEDSHDKQSVSDTNKNDKLAPDDSQEGSSKGLKGPEESREKETSEREDESMEEGDAEEIPETEKVNADKNQAISERDQFADNEEELPEKPEVREFACNTEETEMEDDEETQSGHEDLNLTCENVEDRDVGGPSLGLEIVDGGETSKRATKKRKLDRMDIYDPKKLEEMLIAQESVLGVKKNIDMEDLIEAFDAGWTREVVIRGVYDEYTKSGKPARIPADVYYFTPEGTKLRSMVQITNYLRQVKSSLTSRNFNFVRKPIYKQPWEHIRHASAGRGRSSTMNSPRVSTLGRPEIVIENDADDGASPVPIYSPPVKSFKLKNSPGRRGRPPKVKVTPMKRQIEVLISSPPSGPIPMPPEKPVESRTVSATPIMNTMLVTTGTPTLMSLVNQVVTPVSRVVTPVSRVLTPVSRVVTPVSQVMTPVPQLSTPVSQVAPVKVIRVSPPIISPLTKKKATARKSTTQKSFKFKVSPSSYLDDLCTMHCPGMGGMPPTLHCGVCMCLFHQECVNFKNDSGATFVCLRCQSVPGVANDQGSENAKSTPPATTAKENGGSIANNLMMVEPPSTLGSLVVTPDRLQGPSQVQIKVEPGTEPQTLSGEMSNGTNLDTSDKAITDVRHQTLGSLRTILDRRINNGVGVLQSVIPSTDNCHPDVLSPPVLSNHMISSGRTILNGPVPSLTTSTRSITGAIPTVVSIASTAGPPSGNLPLNLVSTGNLPLSVNLPPMSMNQALTLLPPQLTAAPLLAVAPTPPIPATVTSNAVTTSGIISYGGSPGQAFKNGQLLTLPPAVAKRLNLQLPLALKINNMQVVVPSSCFLNTSEGLKVFLPPKTFPVQTGQTAQLSVTVSNGKPHISIPTTPIITTTASTTAVQESEIAEVQPIPVPVETSGKERKKRCFKSGVNPLTCSIQKLYGGFDCMLHIFQYLGPRDVLRAGTVCRTWHQISTHPCLWKEVSFRDLSVPDWQKAMKYLARRQVEGLNLKGLRHFEDKNRTWHQIVSTINEVKTLRRLQFGQVPSSVVHGVCEKMVDLEIFSAEWITDLNGDQMWTTPTKLDIGKVATMSGLKELRLRGVGGLTLPSFSFSGGLGELSKLNSLQVLSLTSMKKISDEFGFLKDLANLRVLELGDCSSWSSEPYFQLGQLSELTCLRLECGGEAPDVGLGDALQNMKHLERLELIMFTIADSLGVTLSQISTLKTLIVWPDTTSQAAVVNSNTLSVLAKCSQLKQLEWGIVSNKNSSIILDNEETPGNDAVSSSEKEAKDLNRNMEWIPFLPENVSPEAAESDVDLLTEYIGVRKLTEKLCVFLPDTKIKVFSTQTLSPPESGKV